MTLQGLRKISLRYLSIYLKKDILAQELILKRCVYNFFQEVSYFDILKSSQIYSPNSQKAPFFSVIFKSGGDNNKYLLFLNYTL